MSVTSYGIEKNNRYPLTNTENNFKYLLPKEQISNLNALINSKDFATSMAQFFSNSGEFVLSLKVYPFNVVNWLHIGASDLGVLCDDVKIGGDYVTKIKGAKVITTTTPFNQVGLFKITNSYNNFLDYAPYTKMYLFLPYIGYVDLDVNLIKKNIGSGEVYISIDYAVDFDTGKCTAYISRANAINTDNTLVSPLLIDMKEGVIGFDIPIGRTNASEIAKGYITTGLSAIGGAIATALTGGYALPLAVSTFASSSVSLINSSQQHVQKGTIGTIKNAFCTTQKPFIIVERLQPINISKDNNNNNVYAIASLKGKPCGLKTRLSIISGFTKVESVHLENFNNATEDEIQEIESLLKTGVILPDSTTSN